MNAKLIKLRSNKGPVLTTIKCPHTAQRMQHIYCEVERINIMLTSSPCYIRTTYIHAYVLYIIIDAIDDWFYPLKLIQLLLSWNSTSLLEL